jgi:hypothetical protein
MEVTGGWRKLRNEGEKKDAYRLLVECQKE